MSRIASFKTFALLGGIMVFALAGISRADPAPQAGESGVVAFSAVYRVLQSPRCRNCHPAGDAPLHGDEGRFHSMNVSRTSAASGLACTTCHRSKNADQPHAPPGVPGWRMPGADMPLVFEGRTEKALCEQLRDPAQNGGKSLPELVHHVAHDAFVAWGWAPGPGRTVPPISQAELVRSMVRWVADGAPCR